MTTLPPRDDDREDFLKPDRARSVEAHALQVAEIRLACCREGLTDARREVRALRRQARRARRRALRVKVGPCLGVLSSVGLAALGGVAFVVALALLLMGEFSVAKEVLTFAGVAWGGAAAIRTRRI
ncbi:hypothetical protein [Streptomyces sp. NPDC006147]|uniref:hypothetical protein n=1 Tax=Streptomyces sp. NPDC006147 TaxID=3155597 RepID=UPI00339DC1DD